MPARSIDTSIWDDDRFAELSSDAMLVFFRITTGPDTGPAGVTTARPRRLAADTRITEKRANAALEELISVDLVRRYEGGRLWLPAWIKYQVSGPDFIRAVRRQAKDCPEALRKAIDRALNERFPGGGGSDKPRTRKFAKSRDDVPLTPPQTRDSLESLRGEVQDQDQDSPSLREGESPYGTGSNGEAGPAGRGQPASPAFVIDEEAESAASVAALREQFASSELTRPFLKILEGERG